PVAQYVVPVSEFGPPVREVSEVILAAEPPSGRLRGSPRQRPRHGLTATARSPRLLELLRLAEAQPSVPGLQPYLTDCDPRIRRAAIGILTETAPPGDAVALAAAAGDCNGTVRHAAAAGLRELAAIFTGTDGAGETLRGSLR